MSRASSVIGKYILRKVPFSRHLATTSTPGPTKPQVYQKIAQSLATDGDSLLKKLESGPAELADRYESVKRAKEIVEKQGGILNIPRKKKEKKATFLKRLIKDGGKKIVKTEQQFLHVDYTRFVEPCSQIKGLSLEQAFLHLSWNSNQISRKLESALRRTLSRAQEYGLDPNRTYIAEAFVNKGALLSKRMKKYVKGRGRYGATPHPKCATLEILVQERERPFAIKENDPLEWVRQRLRNTMKERGVVKFDKVVAETKRAPKAVYC